jgi:hypothetical protein
MGAFTTTNCWAAFISGCTAPPEFSVSVELLDREPCILISRKGPVPPVCEVEESHAKHEHRVVTPPGTPENPQGPLGIALESFGFHFW